MDRFITRTEEYIREGNLLGKGGRLVAGISGGVDSVCLLEVLDTLRAKWDWDVTAVHIHHGIRGESADEDMEFVRMLCRAKKIDCHIHRVDVPAVARERGLGEEEAGRIVRREILESELAGRGRIVLAHHADDNAETLLLNLCRGSGLYGLGGMSPAGGVYVRPLLWADRAQIEEFACRNHLAFRLDESNADPSYTRNRLRLAVMPYLREHVNARAAEHMNSAMQDVRQAAGYLERETERLFRRYAHDRGEEGLFISADVLGEDPYLVSLLVRHCLIRQAGRAKDIERVHIVAVSELFGRQTGSGVDLPYGMRAQLTYGGVLIRSAGRRDEDTAGEQKTEDVLPEMTAQSRFIRRQEAVFESSDPYTKYFDYGIIGEQSEFRARQPGDYIVIDREGHRQKLKDWFIDHKIPRGQRGRIPLLADGSHVYWIVGYRQAEDCLITEATDTIIEWRVRLHEF